METKRDHRVSWGIRPAAAGAAALLGDFGETVEHVV